MSSTAVASTEGEFEALKLGLNKTRYYIFFLMCESKSCCTGRLKKDAWWIYLTLFYVPIGVLLLVVRVCISIQAFLMLLVLPNNFPLRRQVRGYNNIATIYSYLQNHVKGDIFNTWNCHPAK